MGTNDAGWVPLAGGGILRRILCFNNGFSSICLLLERAEGRCWMGMIPLCSDSLDRADGSARVRLGGSAGVGDGTGGAAGSCGPPDRPRLQPLRTRPNPRRMQDALRALEEFGTSFSGQKNMTGRPSISSLFIRASPYPHTKFLIMGTFP